MSSSKQYGLNMPKKLTQNMVQKHSIFGDDSNSDSEGELKKRREPTQAIVKRQTKLDIQKALEQDSTVFQYDEVYDQLDQKRQSKDVKEKERKPKYIQKLLVAADKRKIENERRIERQVQKERDQEGEEFKDKETFVTSAYKKKLEEFAQLDAEQQRQDMLEEIGDVTKQQDISGFYRHLYQTTVGPKEEKPEVKKEERHYRKRNDSESSSDKKDADSDSSSSSSSSSDSESEEKSDSETEDPKKTKLTENSNSKPDKVEEKEEEPIPLEPIPVIDDTPTIDIWEKRTVGPVFDAALQRYLERKAARLATAH